MKTDFSSKTMLLSLIVALSLIIYLQGCKHKDDPAPQPVITHITPESGFAGSTVSISGKGFSTVAQGNIVTINSIRATVQEIQGDSLLKIIVPDTATSGAVEVKIGSRVAGGPLFIIPRNPNPPVINSISPSNVEPGDLIIIKGSNFKTGKEFYQNTVRISGIKVIIDSALSSATELRVYVPGVPKNPSGSKVTVSILGTQSNPKILQVQSFAGKMMWASIGYNTYNAYWITAEADGSTFPGERKTLSITKFRDSFVAGGGNGIENPFILSNVVLSHDGKNLYLVKDSTARLTPFINPYFSYHQVVYQTTLNFENIKPIYQVETDEKYDNGISGLATDHYDNGFYIFTEDKGHFMKKFTDGNSPIQIVREFNFYSPYAITAQSPNSFYIYSYYDNNMKEVRKVPLDPNKPYTTFLSGRNITSMEYNPADNYLYFLEQVSLNDVSIYRIKENGTSPEKLASYNQVFTSGSSIKFVFARYLRVLPGSNGSSTKLFWVNRSGNGSDEILMLNLKGPSPYKPVVLYDKPNEVISDPSTRPQNIGSPSNRLDFFTVQNQ